MQLLTKPTDLVWVLFSGFLVMLMQAGFICLESGMVRAKNSTNVAIKNLVDFCLAGVLFYFVGFGLMFGASAAGVVGTTWLIPDFAQTPNIAAFFFFQMVFCGTATTIVSGAVAERMRFTGYCAVTVVLSALVYPVVGHWVWGGVLEGTETGWLARLGFIDFAGSTVVHSVGGWMALAALLVIGPRAGRFGPQGRPIEGHNLTTATLGVFLLWFGWFGFNGGSTFAINNQVPTIVVNTALAGVAGGLAGLAGSWLWLKKPVVDRIINGVLAGLVAITASCHLQHPLSALLIGAIGGAVCVACAALLVRLKIDDAIGAVPVHLAAGIWGTLALPLLAPDGSWGTGLSRLQQLGVQAIGVCTIGAYAGVTCYILLRLINRVMRLRVTLEQERVGLNISEHGSSTAILDLLAQMQEQAERGAFSEPVQAEPETEANTVAVFYNAVSKKLHDERQTNEVAQNELNRLANYDELTNLANRHLYFDVLAQAVARAEKSSGQGAVLYMDLDNFKEINGRYGHAAGDQVLSCVAERLASNVRKTDLLARIGGDEFSVILESIDNNTTPTEVATTLIATVAKPISLEDGTLLEVTMSVGISFIDGREHINDPDLYMRRAEEAMTSAKRESSGAILVWQNAHAAAS